MNWAEARARGHWLLDLEVAGVVYRYGTSGVEVETDDGDTLIYTEGLTDLSLPLVQDGGAELSVGIEIVSGEDWALLESRGYPVERSRCTLRRWHEGQNLERARVYARGLALAASYGTAGEALTFDLVRDPRRESDLIPAMWEVATDDSWPVRVGGQVLAGRITGAAYPIVIGYPGDMQEHGSYPAEPVVPCLMIEWKAATADSRLLVGAGRIDLPASTFRIRNDTTGNEANSHASDYGYTPDGLGVYVTYTSFAGTAEANGFGTAEDAYYVGFGTDGGGGGYRGGGLLVDGEVLAGAGDVLQWVLRTHSTMAFDAAMHAGFADWLNQFRLDTWINQQVNTWEWVESTLLKWLPVIVREGPDGLYFLPVRWDYTASDVVAILDADRHEVARATPLKRLDHEVYNEITVRYAPGRGAGKWTKQFTITGDSTGSPVDDTRIERSFLARLSQARYGVRPYTLDLAHTWHPATARAIAWLLLGKHAWPKRAVSYTGTRELEALDPGCCVAVTDSAVSLDEATAYLVDVRIDGEQVTLDLILLDHPVT